MDLSAFRDPALARDLVASIQKLAPERDTYLMEVCGTHTVAIARGGLASILPDKVHLISGPGCPVCVTANRDIDAIIALVCKGKVDSVLRAKLAKDRVAQLLDMHKALAKKSK